MPAATTDRRAHVPLFPLSKDFPNFVYLSQIQQGLASRLRFNTAIAEAALHGHDLTSTISLAGAHSSLDMAGDGSMI